MDIQARSTQKVGVFNFETKTVLLSSGYEMPILGLGTYCLSDDECFNSVTALLDAGGRLIDTAHINGNEENNIIMAPLVFSFYQTGETVLKDAFIKTKEKGEETQNASHDTPTEYTSDNIQITARSAAEETVHHMPTPRRVEYSRQKAGENWNRAKRRGQSRSNAAIIN